MMGLFSIETTYPRVLLVFIIFPLCVPQIVETYRILGIFPFEGKSHFVMFESILRSLAESGHQVDVVSHYPLKKPMDNYRDIVDLTGTRSKIVGSFSTDFAFSLDKNVVGSIATEYGNKICEIMHHEKMRSLIESLRQEVVSYDIVITEIFGSDCYIGFGHMMKKKIPVVGAVSSMDHVWVDHFMGNPLNLATMPHQYYGDPEHFDYLNFWDRLSNTMSAVQQIWEYSRKTEPQTDMARKYIDANVPDIGEMRRNLALLLVNSHFSLFGVKPFGPSTVEVGGIHVEKNTDESTPELKKWLDESTRGIVYFSLGSLIAIETIPEKTLDGILSSFAKIAPVRVLVKIANESLIDLNKLPKNVKILPWIPQVPVLRHKNTRAFITHGGLMGTMEAMYHQVPMIGIPFFADQARNIHMYASKKLMIPLAFHDINEKSFGDALAAVLQDPKYKNAAVEMSKKFRDRPLTAAATAVFWIEYVIRNGADSLKSPSNQLYWFQSMLFDVYTFFLFIIIVIVFVAMKISNAVIQSNKQKRKRD